MTPGWLGGCPIWNPWRLMTGLRRVIRVLLPLAVVGWLCAAHFFWSRVVGRSSPREAPYPSESARHAVASRNAAEKLTPADAAEKLTPADAAKKLTPADAAEKLTPADAAEKLTPADAAEKLTPADAAEKLTPADANFTWSLQEAVSLGLIPTPIDYYYGYASLGISWDAWTLIKPILAKAGYASLHEEAKW